MTPASLSAAAAIEVPPWGTTTSFASCNGPGLSHCPRSQNPVTVAAPPISANQMTVHSRVRRSPARNEGPSSSPSSSPRTGGSGGGAEDDRRVRTAKAKTIRKGQMDLSLLRLMRHPIDHAVPTGLVEIEGGRRHTVANGENGKDRLDRAGRAKQV